MLKDQTVFVLGAGASVELDIPDGRGLALRVAGDVNWETDGFNITRGDGRLFDVLRNGQPDRANAYLQAGQIIARGLPGMRSIDDFLFNHGRNADVVRVGKVAIASNILKAEAASKLIIRQPYSPDAVAASYHGLRDTWLHRLFAYMATGVRREDAANIFNGFRVINFNYDRCVETFFCYALQAVYSLSANEAQTIVAELDIHHPYGQVGGLPWQNIAGPKVEFGANAVGGQLLPLAEKLRTFTEREDGDIAEWQTMLRGARQIVLLGFGFHAQNLELIDPGVQAQGPWPAAYATTYLMPFPAVDLVKASLDHLRGQPPAGYSAPSVFNGTCADWVDHFGLVVSERN